MVVHVLHGGSCHVFGMWSHDIVVAAFFVHDGVLTGGFITGCLSLSSAECFLLRHSFVILDSTPKSNESFVLTLGQYHSPCHIGGREMTRAHLRCPSLVVFGIAMI